MKVWQVVAGIGLAVGIGAAVLAGLYPALRMARLRPAHVLRDE